ncbi:epithelial cell-transforming sequence 2 oncogene-like isoform X2 [Thalassophryne amazonica]|uniref:epithelial cell-transforming sequence 2 oncogene-like isoform X2 n=1 Tax=Thalassophryne amazonica TaxID=390379 RepID=UPI0014715889|nr:epithelial cell-transforming sequence 2 oncogene-like isoform X2 [Thalassophryne amazonica]
MEARLGPRTRSAPQRQPGRSLSSECRFSSWTPLSNTPGNAQLFEERVNLLLHWFDLWSDRQRKYLLHCLLTRCTQSQLKYCKDLVSEKVPVAQVDFTTVLPQFLSMYVMSFLSPRDLCCAAQVSWHWRFLTEQDCLWADRCIRRGWFLPYCPVEKEFGAWKNHYISCVSKLNWLTPREVAEQYGSFHQQNTGINEEEDERRKERRIRQMIRDKRQEEKRLAVRTRRAWGSNIWPEGTRDRLTQTRTPSSGMTVNTYPSLSWPARSLVSSSLDGQPMTASQSLEKVRVSDPVSEGLNKSSAALSCLMSRLASSHTVSPVPSILLISDRIPAYELVLSGVKAGVAVVLYDHRETLAALLSRVERAVSAHRVKRLGILAPGGTEEVHLLHNCIMSERSMLNPDHREFWDKLCCLLTLDGEGIDIFSPLAASAPGLALIQTVSTLTGLEVRTPMGLATGSFQNILGEWSDGTLCHGVLKQRVSEQAADPAMHYVCESVLQGWCRQAQWMEDALGQMRDFLRPQLQRLSLDTRGRALGYFLWETICLEELCVSKDLSEALTAGLTALTREKESRPVEFLSVFLSRWGENESEEQEKTNKEASGASSPPLKSQECFSVLAELPQTVLDWRGAVARELHHSECLYLSRLAAVLKVYHEPLTAALNTNRVILSYTDIHIILRPVTQILEVNSLQELLLSPVWRIEEYVTLLQALSLHTHPGHPDHTHLCSALSTLLQHREFIYKLKRNSERDKLLEETQQLIRGCPNLSEGSRQLIFTQDAALMRTPDESIPESLRMYEHVSDVGLFLFTDVLVLTRRSVRHVPFTLAQQSTHSFLASAALSGLTVREVTHSRY